MNDSVTIPLEMLEFRVSRSSGPGGQHVNKTDSKVEAMLHIGNASFLSDEQRIRVQEQLAKRINKDGYLSVTCQQTRSQLTNKEIAIEKLQALVSKALIKEKPRKPTKVPNAVKVKRLKAKKINAEKKQARSNWKNDL